MVVEMGSKENDSYYIVASIEGLGNVLLLNPQSKYNITTIDVFLIGFKTHQDNENLNGFNKDEFWSLVAKTKGVNKEQIKDVFIVHSYYEKGKTNGYKMSFLSPIYRDTFPNEDLRAYYLKFIKTIIDRANKGRGNRVIFNSEPAITNLVNALSSTVYGDINILRRLVKSDSIVSPKIQEYLKSYLNSGKVTNQGFYAQKILDSISSYGQVHQFTAATLDKTARRIYERNNALYPAQMFGFDSDEQITLFEANRRLQADPQINMYDFYGLPKEEKRSSTFVERPLLPIDSLLSSYARNEISLFDLRDEIYRLYDNDDLVNMPSDVVLRLNEIGILSGNKIR